MSHSNKISLREVIIIKKKTFLAGNIALFIKSSLDNLAYEASLPRAVTYAIYSETCIIVLGQLLRRLLILIKQSLPKRKHHLFYHWTDGINGHSVGTLENSTKILYYFDSDTRGSSFVKYHRIKFQIKLYTQQFIGFLHVKCH